MSSSDSNAIDSTVYDYDLFVIGAGSGGVRLARMSAGMGKKVAVAEEAAITADPILPINIAQPRITDMLIARAVANRKHYCVITLRGVVERLEALSRYRKSRTLNVASN